MTGYQEDTRALQERDQQPRVETCIGVALFPPLMLEDFKRPRRPSHRGRVPFAKGGFAKPTPHDSSLRSLQKHQNPLGDFIPRTFAATRALRHQARTHWAAHIVGGADQDPVEIIPLPRYARLRETFNRQRFD